MPSHPPLRPQTPGPVAPLLRHPPPPPNHSDTPSIPHALTCRHHKCLPQPNASLALGLPREHPGAAGTDPRGHRPPRHNEGSDPTHSGRGGSDLTCTMGTPSPRTSRGTDLTCRAGTPTPRARRRHPHAHMAGTPTPHARRGHRPGSASPAASSPPPDTPRTAEPKRGSLGLWVWEQPHGRRWGRLFACSFAYGLDEAGGEVAHAVVAGPVVVNAALPAPVHVLLQHLRAGAGSGAGATSGVPPVPVSPPPPPSHTHGDDVPGFHVEAGQVVVVAIVLDGPDLQSGGGVCGDRAGASLAAQPQGGCHP